MSREENIEQATKEIQNLAAEDIGRVFNRRDRLKSILNGLWLTALREPSEREIALPDSEGWWWEWCGVRGWICRNLVYGLGQDLRQTPYEFGYEVRPGRWVRCEPPASPTPPLSVDAKPEGNPHVLDFFTGPAKAAMQEIISPADMKKRVGERELAAEVERLTRERDEARTMCLDYASRCGEAEGKIMGQALAATKGTP